MNFSSDSDMESPFQPNQQNSATTRQKTKHKKIKKDHKKESYQVLTSVGLEIQNIMDFIKQQGNKYFGKNMFQLENQLKSSIKASVHIKNILGLQQNVYQIKNYEKSQNTAMEYCRLIADLQKLKHLKVGLRCKPSKLMVYCSLPKKKCINKKRSGVRILTKTEILLWRQRKALLKQIQIFFQRIPNLKEETDLSFLQKEILTLCKLNALQENQIIDEISQKSQQNDSLFKVQEEESDCASKQISNQYIECLIRKNLNKGFDQTPIDFLNYFKLIENGEKNIYDDVPLKKIKNLGQFKDYIKSRRSKQGKPQVSLRTCCAGCFSNYYELSNPIQTCPDCGMRMHKFCQQIKSKCQRCKYFRKISEEKNQIKICKICQGNNEKGLLIQSIGEDGNEEYAHTFCLLVHNLWTIEDGSLKGVTQHSNSDQNKCKVCNKLTKHYLECLDCEEKVHGMCAYLAGYSLQMSSNKAALVSCCRPKQEQERLSLERRYKLNYEKMLYKSGNDLFTRIERV